MYYIVINLILLFILDNMISNPRKPIRINRNDCIFEIKMYSLGIY